MKKRTSTTFFKSRSYLPINKPNLKMANITSDWKRESEQGQMTVNGVDIKAYVNDYEHFQKKEDLALFFENIILKDADFEDKKTAINYLMQSFHQGGLMYPVTSALAVCFFEDDPETDSRQPFASVNNPVSTIAITTTKNGFNIKQTSTIEHLIVPEGTSFSGRVTTDDGYKLFSDQGLNYVVQASGTIQIDFSKNQDNPAINIENNWINYGHSELKKVLDQRTFTERLIDFIQYWLSLTGVNDTLTDEKSTESSLLCSAGSH